MGLDYLTYHGRGVTQHVCSCLVWLSCLLSLFFLSPMFNQLMHVVCKNPSSSHWPLVFTLEHDVLRSITIDRVYRFAMAAA